MAESWATMGPHGMDKLFKYFVQSTARNIITAHLNQMASGTQNEQTIFKVST